MGPYQGHPSITSNPTMGHVTLAAYEGLALRDVNGKYRGQLAEGWSIAPDNRVWTLKLNKGVQFHGGWGEMVAEDVIWSHSEAGVEGSRHGGTAQIRRAFSNPDGYMQALDDYTIELDTGIPQWDVLVYLATPGVDAPWVVSKRQVEEMVASIGLDAANSQLVGTGPWEMVDHRTGEFFKFKAVLDHYRKTPYFAEMTFFEIPELSTQIANFQIGKLDVFQTAPDTLPTMAALSGTKFMSQSDVTESHLGLYGSWYEYVGTPQQRPGYNPDKLPYVSSNPDPASPEWERARKVREAMAISIDRQKIIDELLGGEGNPLSMWGWVGHGDRALPKWTWKYDLERAKQLMKDAGYEDGFEVQLSPAIRGVPVEVEACEAVADMWADIGIKARLQRVPYGTIRPSIIARTLEGVTCHASNPQPSPLVVFGYTFNPENSWNAGVEHPYITPRLIEARDTFDDEERWRLTVAMTDWIWDNVLDIGLYSQNNVYALGPKLDPWLEHLLTADPRRISGLEWAPHRK